MSEHKVDMFYDRQFLVWVIRIIDDNGNQIGDCEYAPNKQEAKNTAMWMIEND